MFELLCNILLFVFLGFTYFTHVLEAKVPKSYMKNPNDPSLSMPPLANTFWSYMLVSQEGKEKKGKQQMKEIY